MHNKLDQTSNLSSRLRWSQHARVRMQQRSISARDLELVLVWGRESRVDRRGHSTIFVGHRDVRRARAAGVDLGRAGGVALVVSAGGVVVTTIRCREGVRRWRRG